jgi:hypothetical protein
MNETNDTPPPSDGPSPAPLSSPSFAYSTDEEQYYGKYPSREAALADAFSDPDIKRAWTGECVVPARMPDADNLIEQVAERTTEESGEWAEGYLMHVSKEARADLQGRLQTLWDEWEVKWKEEPAFYNIENVERHEASECVEENPKFSGA